MENLFKIDEDLKCPLCRKIVKKKEKKTIQSAILRNSFIESSARESFDLFDKASGERNQYSASEYEKKCLKCNRPIGTEHWKTYCTWCYAKVTGTIVKCSACTKRLPIFRNQLKKKNYCVDCYRKRNGNSSKCGICELEFYFMPMTSYSSSECEKCYLAAYGVKLSCKDCRKEIYVMEDQIEWKDRCYECWLIS